MASIPTRATGCPRSEQLSIVLLIGSMCGDPLIAHRADIRSSIGHASTQNQCGRHDAADNKPEEQPRHERTSLCQALSPARGRAKLSRRIFVCQTGTVSVQALRYGSLPHSCRDRTRAGAEAGRLRLSEALNCVEHVATLRGKVYGPSPHGAASLEAARWPSLTGREPRGVFLTTPIRLLSTECFVM